MTRIFVYEYLTGGGIDPELASAGSLADLSALIVEGRVMRDALVADLDALDGVSVTFASSRFENVAPGRRHCRAHTGEAMTAFVARAAREHDYAWIVAPECDGLLLQLYDAVGPSRWLGCSGDAIRLASSKRVTAACLAAHGIPVTAAIEPRGVADGQGNVSTGNVANENMKEDPATRWVVKPDDGAGGLDTWIFDDYAAACAEHAARRAAARNPVLQQWVEGEPLSLSLVCDERQADLVSINRQQISIGERDAPGARTRIVEFDGVAVNQIPLDSADGRVLEALAQRVVAALPGLRGFAGIDVVWHPQRGPVVIEVNPRLTVAYAGLTAALRENLAARLLLAFGVPAAATVAIRGDDAHADAAQHQPLCGATR